MTFQNRKISPYKDVQIDRGEHRAIGFDEILNDDIRCDLQFENGTRQGARGCGFAGGSYSCTTLREGLQFIACDLDWQLGVNTAALWPASFHLSAVTKGITASSIEGKSFVHPTNGVTQVAGFGQETEVLSLSKPSTPVRMAGLMVAPKFFDALDPELAQGFAALRKLLEPGVHRIVLAEAKTVSDMMQRMQSMPYQGAMGALYLESMALAVLVDLAGHLSDCPGIIAQCDHCKHRLANEARARIDAAPGSIVSPHALAHELGTNETTLRLRFKEVHGVSLMSYVRDLRLNRARQVIRAGRQQISQVAYDCGYAHPANFTHAYRKRFGCSPREDSPHCK